MRGWRSAPHQARWRGSSQQDELTASLDLWPSQRIVYLGVRAVRHRRAFTHALAQRVPPVTPLRAVRDGAIVGATNPKSIVVFVAVMPGFTDPAAGHLRWQLLLLGSVFPVIALFLDSVWALAAGTAREWLAGSPRRLAAIGGTGGLVMIGLGTSLAVTGRKD